jgi:hypothetical protein
VTTPKHQHIPNHRPPASFNCQWSHKLLPSHMRVYTPADIAHPHPQGSGCCLRASHVSQNDAELVSAMYCHAAAAAQQTKCRVKSMTPELEMHHRLTYETWRVGTFANATITSFSPRPELSRPTTQRAKCPLSGYPASRTGANLTEPWGALFIMDPTTTPQVQAGHLCILWPTCTSLTCTADEPMCCTSRISTRQCL